MKLWYMIAIVEIFKLTKGQGHKLKSHGQLCSCVEKSLSMKIRLDLDDTNILDSY